MMEREVTEKQQKRELLELKEPERRVLEKVGHVISSINGSKHVDQVISALHSLAVLLFPIDSPSLLGSIDAKYRDEVHGAKILSEADRSENWRIFYEGAAFRALARVLLYDVAVDWLACFPISARKHVFDVFFVNGRATEVVQAVLPCMQHSGNGSHDTNAVCSNAERLLVLCLLQNDGVLQITREFSDSSQSKDLTSEQLKQAISAVAQLVTSIPDKARPGAPTSLSSHLFFKQITIQLLAGAEEWDKTFIDEAGKFNVDGSILFVGEAFSRICRRGSADVLLSELIPQILRQVRSFLSESTDMDVNETFESKAGLRFWSKIMQAIRDPYSIERMSEQLLHQLAAQSVSDVEAYWTMQMLFHPIYKHQISIRSMFLEKFLLWKVFPIRCLSWIIHFAIIECTPDSSLSKEAYKTRRLSEAVQRLTAAWSKREFVQSASIEQQAYVTAALGHCLEKISKEDLDSSKDAMHSILQGVSCRLENPDHLVRRMASSIALVFSIVIDPQNPLYLDDSCPPEETIDWEFGMATKEMSMTAPHCTGQDANKAIEKEINNTYDTGMSCNVNNRKKNLSEFKIVDPDEIVDPAALSNYLVSDEDDDDNASEDSDTSSDSSLQPYDLSDDATDLRRKFSQLVDVVGALRKSDDADAIHPTYGVVFDEQLKCLKHLSRAAVNISRNFNRSTSMLLEVEGALDVAEKLIRASPDELRYIAGDLVRTLVQVRCSDSTVEGEEESAEEKRQKALVALVVTCPLESLDTLNKLLYSPNLDVSQRIMILDIMTDAAQELACTKVSKPENRPTALISSISDQPWYEPRSTGPPGAGSWKEISTPGTPLNWSQSYERELPAKPGQISRGKTRRWSHKSSVQENQLEWSQNKFPQYAAAFMLPAMEGFDKKRHGVDLLGRDFIVLGKLIYMLGVCMKCAAMHPEASFLGSPLLDMLSSRDLSHHKEAYVRRSVLFAASCILVALHPSYVASALTEENVEISTGLEWVRTWALHVAESDTDRDCYTSLLAAGTNYIELQLTLLQSLLAAGTNYIELQVLQLRRLLLAMTCLQLHAELALQASRALESTESKLGSKGVGLPYNITNETIRIPH